MVKTFPFRVPPPERRAPTPKLSTHLFQTFALAVPTLFPPEIRDFIKSTMDHAENPRNSNVA